MNCQVDVNPNYNGLNVATKQMLDVATGGSLCSKQPNMAQILIKEMATNSYQWSMERNKQNWAARICEVDALAILVVQVEAVTKRFDEMQLLQ